MRATVLLPPTRVVDRLDVHDCVVKNVYLRGIYARNPAGAAGSFNIHNNTVQNVEGDYDLWLER